MALVLKREKKPAVYLLEYGVTVTCRPLTTAIRSAAMTKATRESYELKEHQEAITDAGGEVSNVMDLNDPDASGGLYGMYFAMALAEYGITDWTGVLDENEKPLEPTTENVRLLMADSPVIADSFLRQYQAPVLRVKSEGNGSGLSQNGTSAGDRNTAEPVAQKAKTAAAKRQNGKKTSAPTSATRRKQPKAKRSSKLQGTSPDNG